MKNYYHSSLFTTTIKKKKKRLTEEEFSEELRRRHEERGGPELTDEYIAEKMAKSFEAFDMNDESLFDYKEEKDQQQSNQTHQTNQTNQQIKEEEEDTNKNARKAFRNENYVKMLKKFFLKVHPDFFHYEPIKQEQNKNSFAKLNELLNWSNEYFKIELDNLKGLKENEILDLEQRLHRLGNIPCLDETFIFYLRQEQQKNNKLNDGENDKIEVLFSLPKKLNLNGKLKSRLTLSFRLEELVTTLLEKSKIITKEEAKQRREIALKEFNESTTNKKNEKRSLKDELRIALQNNLQNANIEKLRQGNDNLQSIDDDDFWWDTDLPSIEYLIKNRLVHFSVNLTDQQIVEGFNRLQQFLPEMKYKEWSEIPLVLSEKTEYLVNTPAEGFITIPYTFDPYDFIKEILENKEKWNALQEKRENTRKKAEAIINMKERLIKECDLADIYFSPSLTNDELYSFLENFEERYIKNEKRRKLLKDICLCVDYKYNIANDGTLTMAWNFMEENNNKDSLLEFFRALGVDKIKRIKELGRSISEMKKQIKIMGEEIIEHLKCRELDITTHNDFPNLERKEVISTTFETLKRFKENVLFSLEKFDWTGYAFYLVNGLDMPKDHIIPMKNVYNVGNVREKLSLMKRVRTQGTSFIDFGARAVYINTNFDDDHVNMIAINHWKRMENPQLMDPEMITPGITGFKLLQEVGRLMYKNFERTIPQQRLKKYMQLAEYLNTIDDIHSYDSKRTKQFYEAFLEYEEEGSLVDFFKEYIRNENVPLESLS